MKEKNQRKPAQGAVPPIKWVDPKLDTAFKIILGNARFLLPMIQDLFGELGLPNVSELAFDLDRVQQASTLTGKSGSLDLGCSKSNFCLPTFWLAGHHRRQGGGLRIDNKTS
jgi:hypothetical protein